MPTTTTGLFFLGRQRPEAMEAPAASGQGFRLTLRVLDNQGPHRVEPYVVTWTGDDARAWWREHSHIQPGQPLALELTNPRSITGARGAPETHATVRHCTLAPLAPSCQKARATAAAAAA